MFSCYELCTPISDLVVTRTSACHQGLQLPGVTHSEWQIRVQAQRKSSVLHTVHSDCGSISDAPAACLLPPRPSQLQGP